MRILLIIAIFICSSLNFIGQEKKIPESFSYLKSVELLSDFNIEQLGTPEFFYNPEITEVINRPIDSTHILYKEWAVDICLHEFAITKIDKNSNVKYHICFDYGMSYDPNFTIYKVVNDSPKHILSVNGMKMYIPGNGNIYIEGHTNNYFNERRKFKLSNDSIVEVNQPFKYVGIKTKSNGVLKLYSTMNQKELVAVLPKNSEIEVLINMGNYYLIKSSFGLVGWWEFDGYYSEDIKEIFFNGD
ncbi:hypothetical protein [Saccharicrinis sp. FJH54]|uniref:hypothetical protein n=1 Tax=Saccharicrinis sp. FJH54 TaxID=3344665 RepID=UPI0035D4B947